MRETWSYWDTQDGRLWKKRLRLRRRHGDGLWELSSLDGGEKAAQEDAAGIPEEGPLGERLRSLTGPMRLLHHLDMRASAVRPRARWFSRPREEGWVRTGAREGEDPFASGLAALGLPVPGAPIPGELRLEDGDTIARAGRKVIAQQAYRMWANTEGTLRDADPEYLHDLRVATRRLRFAMRLFDPVLAGTPLDALREEAAWIGRTLGAVRDLDVLLDGVRANLPRAGPNPEGEREILGALGALRAPLRAALEEALRSRRYDRLLSRLRAVAHRRTARGDGAALATEVAPGWIGKAARRLLKKGGRRAWELPPEELHRLRIAFKRLRYTCEYFSILFGDDLDPLIRACVKVQDALGAHQDAMVAIGRLGEIASGGRGREAVLALGALAQLERVRAEACRLEFAERWVRFPDRLRKALGALGDPGA